MRREFIYWRGIGGRKKVLYLNVNCKLKKVTHEEVKRGTLSYFEIYRPGDEWLRGVNAKLDVWWNASKSWSGSLTRWTFVSGPAVDSSSPLAGTRNSFLLYGLCLCGIQCFLSVIMDIADVQRFLRYPKNLLICYFAHSHTHTHAQDVQTHTRIVFDYIPASGPRLIKRFVNQKVSIKFSRFFVSGRFLWRLSQPTRRDCSSG